MEWIGKPVRQTEYSYNPLVSAYPHVAGAFVLLYFEFHYQDMQGNWHWSNMSNTGVYDYIPDCFVFEQANRWFWYEAEEKWIQSDNYNIWFNFFIDWTTHDTDFHDIRAGWQWSESEQTYGYHKTFTHPTHERFNDWFTWLNNWCYWEGIGYNIYQIDALRLKAIAFSVECYRARFDMKFHSITIHWQGP
jgi:hypothetical protein